MKRSTLLACIMLLGVVSVTARTCHGAAPTEDEAELLAILQSDASPAEKALVCKKLAVVGSASSAPALCELLADPKLASWARIALEVIPGQEVDEALCKRLEDLQGRELMGAIQSVGERRCMLGVPILVALLEQNEDESIAEATATALGRIGGKKSEAALSNSLGDKRDTVRKAAAEAYIRCAERLLADHLAGSALEIYIQVAEANVPKTLMLQATRGSILSDEQGGLARLRQALESSDERVFQIGMSTACEMDRPGVTQVLTDLIGEAGVERQPGLIGVLTYRGDQAALPSIMELASSTDPEISKQALVAIGKLGDAKFVRTLIESAQGNASPTMLKAVSAALQALSGSEVDTQIVQLASEVDGQGRQLLIDAIGSREIDAIPVLLNAANSSDPAVRSSAWIALGKTIDQEHFKVLVDEVVSPSNEVDSQSLAKALQSAARRMPEAQTATNQLAEALDNAPATTKTTIIQALAAVDAPAALKVVAEAAGSGDDAVENAATAALGKWSSKDAAPVLLAIATRNPASKYKIRALRGYIRIARQFDLEDAERFAMFEHAVQSAKRDAERQLIFDAMQVHASMELLEAIRASEQSVLLKPAAPAIAAAVLEKSPTNRDSVAKCLSDLGIE